tara:strand:+ start:3728 stop:4138 length:411 start_codon:yes stop_codon:yes gene_type:complete
VLFFWGLKKRSLNRIDEMKVVGNTGQSGDYLSLRCGRPFLVFYQTASPQEDILSFLKNDVVANFAMTKSKPLLAHQREPKTKMQNFPMGRVGGKVKGSLGRHRKECAESAVNASCWLLMGLEGENSLGAPGTSQER